MARVEEVAGRCRRRGQEAEFSHSEQDLITPELIEDVMRQCRI